MTLTLFFAIIPLSLLYVRIKRREAEFGRIVGLYKPVKKLIPGESNIQKYKEVYIHRESDTTIENLLKDRRDVLITGKPKIGKTRAAYEAIKKLENFSVIKPDPEMIEIEKVKIPTLSYNNIILFLDDLDGFVDQKVDNLISRLKKKSEELVVVATCRTGEKLDRVKEEILPLYRELTCIELEEINQEEGRKLAEEVGLYWKPEQFDGTPGSIILDLEDMKERYKKIGHGQLILKALKLLREGNVFTYRVSRVKTICADIFEFPTENLKRYNWDLILNNLKENDFINIDEDIVYIHTSYLDTCVYDYNPSLNDLMKLKNILITEKDLRSLCRLGNELFYQKDFRLAEDCYRESLRIYLKYAPAHSGLGRVLTKLGESEVAKERYDEAERIYKEAAKEHTTAIRISPYYAVGHNYLGQVLTRLGEINETKGQLDEATSLFKKAEKKHRKAIELKQEYAFAHYALAYVLVKLGQVEEAVNEYRETIRLNPDWVPAHNNLGYLLAKVDRDEEAEKEYREAIRGDPNYVVAYHNLGHLLVDLGRYKEAEQEYRKALNINSDYAEVCNSLGFLLVRMDRYEEADNEFRKAIKIKPNFAEAHTNFGYLLAKMGNTEKTKGRSDEAGRFYKEAEKEYRKALQLSSNNEDTMVCLGVLMERLNKHKEAEDCYKKVIEKNPNNIKARNTYGYFLSYCGREKEAARQFDEVVKIDPNDPKPLLQLTYLHSSLSNTLANHARALTKSGRFHEAEKEVREAIRLNTNNALAHKTFGILLEEIGDKSKSDDDRLRLYE